MEWMEGRRGREGPIIMRAGDGVEGEIDRERRALRREMVP